MITPKIMYNEPLINSTNLNSLYVDTFSLQNEFLVFSFKFKLIGAAFDHKIGLLLADPQHNQGLLYKHHCH